MKKIFPFAVIAAVILIMSCQSGNNEKTTAASETASAATDSLTVRTDSVEANQMEDPDPTDTIPASAYGINTYRKEAVALAKSVLTEQYKKDLAVNLVDTLSRRFVIIEYDLNDDNKKEIFVGLNGHYFCGTGGCNVLLLSPEGKLITRFTVTNTPIVISRERSKGWNDLIIDSKGKNYLVKFDGNKYPSNPSVQPVFKMVPGDELPRVLDYVHEGYPWFGF